MRRATRVAGASVGKVFDTDGTNTMWLPFTVPHLFTGLALGGMDELARFTFQGLVHDATTRRWHALVGGANAEGVPWLFAQVLKPMRPIQLEQYAHSMARFASGVLVFCVQAVHIGSTLVHTHPPQA